MKKTLTLAVLCAALSTFALATCRVHAEKSSCPGHAKASSAGCSAHMQAVSDGFALLEKDLTVLKAGAPESDKDRFLANHVKNLEKVLSARAECEKSCGARHGAMAKSCSHMEPMAEGMNSLSKDLETLKAGPDKAYQEPFFQAHLGNLEKVIALRADCQKVCHAKGTSTDKS